MEWNLMEPDSSGASGLGCFVEDVYIPADDCEDVLDEIIETLTQEDPKLRNGRRKLSFSKIVERDLVPLIMCSVDAGIIARSLRLLANLTQPLEVFVQLGVPLGQQCQREINTLVSRAKTCCTNLDFFKNLHGRMETALFRHGREKVHPADSELLNHALLLLRNLIHTSPDDSQTLETSITLQSMLSSFFLSEMDKLVLVLLNHPQKADWVVSNVQLLSLVFKNYAGTLLEQGEDEDKDDDDCKSDVGSGSDMFEFIPSHMSKLLSHNFDKQLQIGEIPMIAEEMVASPSDVATGHLLQCCGAVGSTEEPDEAQQRAGKKMVMDENTDQDDGVGNGEKSDNGTVSPIESFLNEEEDMAVSEVCVKEHCGKSMHEQGVSERDMYTCEPPDKPKQVEGQTETEKQANKSSIDSDSGRPESSEEEKQGERTASEREVGGDSGVEEHSLALWDNLHMVVAMGKEREIMSELSSGSCLMDGDIIVAYVRKFATDILCSGLNNLVQCLMKVLLNSQEGVLEDSFFMWTVGFFLSFARHTHIEFNQYRYLLNLDVFGFLAYQGYRNCEILTGQVQKQEICPLIRYRLHLVVCTLNQLFQVILTHNREMGEDDGNYIHTLQKCLAQMADLRRLFILLLRSHQSPYDMVYLRDLIHANNTYLLLLEDWVSQGYIPAPFSMLSHIKQYADDDVVQKYGSLLEQYATNNESLNVAIMTMMYHIAGDCNRDDVLLQLPILKTFSEIWGDVLCRKYAEFNDLIEFIMETFMSMASSDPAKCAQKLFNMTGHKDVNSSGNLLGIGGLTEEEQDLLFTWTTELQGSVNMVDDLVTRLHSRGSSATRQQVMLHLLHNGWLEEKQMEALSEEIKELQGTADKAKRNSIMAAELSGLTQEQLLPFLLAKIRGAGHEGHLRWLQDQLLEAAYVRLGVRDCKYRVHVEEPLARFYALQDKSIPLVTVNEEEDRAVRDPYFTTLLQGLGLFPADAVPTCVFCRIPQFLTPAQLLSKAQQLGDIDLSLMKFDPTKVKDELSDTEFSSLFRDADRAKEQEMGQDVDMRLPSKNQGHQWLNFVGHFNQSKECQSQSQSQA